MSERIRTHRGLIVYQKSFAAGKRIFELSKSIPLGEMYSLTEQVRRSSRSVSANIAGAETAGVGTQVWIEYASTPTSPTPTSHLGAKRCLI